MCYSGAEQNHQTHQNSLGSIPVVFPIARVGRLKVEENVGVAFALEWLRPPVQAFGRLVKQHLCD